MSANEPLVLPSLLDMTAAAPLASALLERRSRPLIVDASQVRRIGGQCLQVLLSARSTWIADGQPFRVVNPSPEFGEGLALMGAGDLADLQLIEEEVP